MPNWRHMVQLKDLLSREDVSPERAMEIGQVMAQRIRSLPFINRKTLAEGFEDVQDQDSFNDMMADLYDSADEQRIWIK